MNRQYIVYLMTNPHNTVIYTGVTSDLHKRTCQHKEKTRKGFTAKYNVNKLVYYEAFDDSVNAIVREKQIKAGSRENKVRLIESINPEWKDLSEG
jgi:putative endonuclease